MPKLNIHKSFFVAIWNFTRGREEGLERFIKSHSKLDFLQRRQHTIFCIRTREQKNKIRMVQLFLRQSTYHTKQMEKG